MNNKDNKSNSDPIAIVGMAFRLPGDLGDEQSFWQALKDECDLVTRVDPGRWAVDELVHPKRSEPGRSITFSAGVLSRVEDFDAGFFGISSREAAWLDPQQRMLLELAWEAMENGGQVPSRLAGSSTAVYVGISGMDYGLRGLEDLSSMAAHSMTGNTLSVAANRLSYAFDLRGPSLAVDTACSSSLVALHHACNTLRSGEACAALVGGVSLLLHPYPFVGFTKASMLSATGRCRAFDSSGDGYVRSEGGVVLLLKPLSRAMADGDDIQALILATGVNSDGGRKSGLTIPSIDAQAELMQSVLSRAGMRAQDVDFIEAHGTGTPVGDPIEAAAIGRVYGSVRDPDSPLPIGSVKSNLGHLEPASGLAGLIKAVLALKNRALPASLHYVTPNPNIDFAKLNLQVAKDFQPLQSEADRPLVAGVNSFGFGGTNAHVLLQEYRDGHDAQQRGGRSCAPLLLSARTPQALRDVAARYAGLVAGCDFAGLYDIAHGAAFRRERLDKRLALKADDPQATADRLGRFARGEHVPQVVLEEGLDGGVAFIYSGNGAQWVGMGRRLMAESPAFAKSISELDVPIEALAGFSVRQELFADGQASRLDDTAVAQPVLFSIQVGLTRLLRAWGVDATAVAGHSVGEVAAAWAAGALDLDQAIKVVCARSQAQALTRGTGRMAAVGVADAEMRELLGQADYGDVEIAGINSPSNITLSGSVANLERLRVALEPRAVFFRLLDLDHAFHSQHMQPVRDVLVDKLAPLCPAACSAATFVSTVTGEVLDGAGLDAGYWWRNVREPVRLSQAVSTMIRQGCRIFIEIGPHAILQRYLGECLKSGGIHGRVLDTLRRSDDGLARVEETALRAHLLCGSLRLDAMFPEPARRLRLPNYPWQRELHTRPRTSEGYALVERRRIHPLLGWRLKESDAAWENILDPALLRWLADHRVGGAIVLPGSAYVEMALAAAREVFGGARFELEELDIVAPVVFDGENARILHLELSLPDGSFRIRSRQRLSDDEWILNAVGRLLGAPANVAEATTAEWSAGTDAATIDRSTHYRLAASLGLEYGPAFQAVEAVCAYEKILDAKLAVPGADGQPPEYLLHPASLDACFQTLVDFFREDIDAGRGLPLLPVKVGRVRYFGGGVVTRCTTRLLHRGRRSVAADFELQDAEGNLVALVSGSRFRAAPVQRHGAAPSCWSIAPQLMPHPAEQLHVDVPPARDLARLVLDWMSTEEGKLSRAAYFKEALPLFEALTISFAHEAFKALFATRAAWLQQILSDSPAAPHDDRVPWPFFRWLVACLSREELLMEREGTWALEATDIPSAAEIWRTLLRDFPGCLPELLVVGRVGQHLPQLLTGAEDTKVFLETLLNSHPAETLYDDSPAYFGTCLATHRILRHLAENTPSNRRLRILEISGGASDLPRQVGRLVPEGHLDYVLAVANEDVRDRLDLEYQHDPCVLVATLVKQDLELASEAMLPETYDVIVLRHWLHRTCNPFATLLAARRKLAMGGLLVVAERHPDLAADFMHGLDPRWWHSMEAREPLSCLLRPPAWQQALAEQGFEDIETVIEPASQGLSEGSYLLLAKRPEETVSQADLDQATWLLLADAAGESRELTAHLMQHLESRGQRVAVTYAQSVPADGLPPYDAQRADAVAGLLHAARAKLGAIDHVVHLAGWAKPDSDSGTIRFGSSDACIGLINLVRAMMVAGEGMPRLWLVTAGGALASDVPGHRIDPFQGSLWGMGRVIMNEYPALGCTMIDVACDPRSPELAQRLENELLQPTNESEIVLASGARYGLRMRRTGVGTGFAKGPAQRFRLDLGVPGQLRNLAWQADPERALDDDEVEVRVMAAGLNFRDVMYAMGLLPDEAVERGFAGATLGLEFAGVVIRTGPRVREFSPGDAVMGFAPACFASHVVTKTTALAHKPDMWSFEEAATVPTVFFTVYYALKHLANLQPGERVLVHGAAGGVGIAAVQLAGHLGAEIFATAGTDEKRDFVGLLGADHVFDSRSLDFAHQVRAATGGEGVDVVLNSLSGEAIRRNLGLLRPFGRFLELGKRDFVENTPVGLRPFKDNISYFGIDADQVLVSRPELAARLFHEVMSLFREGALSPLPYRAFPAERVIDAFRTMQQSRHIGKVIVTLGDVALSIDAADTQGFEASFERDASYIVTGGLDGFGLESARWLARHGAGNLALLGRRGMKTPGAEQAIREIEALGASVSVFACDVADHAALRSVIEQVQCGMPPLKGILHAAMVLDDALIANLDAERFHRVMLPKMVGARNLHELTLDIPIDYFILYSSITTSIGNPGQANYVAANAYLEGLANQRRSLGLPVTCIGWGPIADAGYLTRNQAVKDSLRARLGAAPLTADGVLGVLGRVAGREFGNLAVADFDWHALARVLPSATGSRFEWLRRQAGKAIASEENGEDFASLIDGKSGEEVRAIVQSMVINEVAKILGMHSERIEPGRSLMELGMDSLMGVELALALEERFRIRLPAMMLNEGPTAERVAERIATKVLGNQDDDHVDEASELRSAVNELATQHGERPSSEEVAQVASAIRDNLRTGTGMT